MDLGDGGGAAVNGADDGGPMETFVRAASADEQAAHANLLEGIARESKSVPIWGAA